MVSIKSRVVLFDKEHTMEDVLYVLRTTDNWIETFPHLYKDGKEVMEEYLKVRKKYINKLEEIPRDILATFTSEIEETVNNLKKRAQEIYNKEPDYHILKKASPLEYVLMISHVFYTKAKISIAISKLVEDIENKNINPDVLLTAPKIYNKIREFFESAIELDIIDMFEGGGYNKIVMEELLRKVPCDEREREILSTPSRYSAPTLIAIKYFTGENLDNIFMYWEKAKNKWIKKVVREFSTNNIENVITRKRQVTIIKNMLRLKYDKHIIDSIDLLLIADNLHNQVMFRIAGFDLETLYPLHKLFNYFKIPLTFKNLMMTPTLLDKNRPATVGEGYLYYNIRRVKQHYNCLVSSSLNAVSAWDERLRTMPKQDFIKLEREIFDEARMKPYGWIHGAPVIESILKRGFADDVVFIYKVSEEFAWADNPDLFYEDKLEEVYKKLEGMGGRSLYWDPNRNSYSIGPLTKEYVRTFIQYARKIYDNIYKDPRLKIIKKEPTPDMVIDLMDDGYVFIATVDTGGMRHNIVLYGYNTNKEQFYFFDQMDMEEIRVKFEDLQGFLRTIYGYGMIGYRKKLESLDKIEDATKEIRNHIDAMKRFL
jgi:hypothetical protein